MKKFPYKVLVIDSGMFVSVALRLAREFEQVFYFSDWAFGGIPTRKLELPGTGFEEITNVDFIFKDTDEYEFDSIDLFVFPDLYHGDLQELLVSLGKRVFGSRLGEELEMYKWDTMQLLKEIGLPVNKSVLIKGLDKLRTHLKKVEDKWIKIDCFRGEFETWHHQTYDISEPMIDRLAHTLGVVKDDTEFIVNDSIDAVCETGSDLVCVDGKYAKMAMFGYEIKDLCYVAKAVKYSELSPLVRGCNDKLEETLKEYQYRGMFSTEIRISKDKTPYLIDITARCGLPPIHTFMEMVTNMGQMWFDAADGKITEPKFEAPYGCEILIHSKWSEKNWQPVIIPDEIRRWVKLVFWTRKNDMDYTVPQTMELDCVGSVVGLGNTMEKAIEQAVKHAEMIKGYDLNIDTNCLEQAKEQTLKGAKLGIKF